MPGTRNSIVELFAPQSPDGLWTSGELASIWKHQLAAPLIDCCEMAGVPFREACAAAGLKRATVGDILHGGDSSLESFIATKDFAKSILARHSELLPGDIASAIYFLSILAARHRLNTRITQLDDATLENALSWLNAQAWLDPASRELAVPAK